MKMISCKNRMPETFKDKLVYGHCQSEVFINLPFYQVAYWSGTDWQITDNLGGEYDVVYGVTHWCDLPAEME